MVTNKRKKVTRQRARRTHGYGLTHRGKGNKGGAGRAGGIKKSNCKKRMYDPSEFGRHGFVRKNKILEKAISTRQLDQEIKTLLQKNKIKQEKDTYTVDLSQIGYDKLISDGKVYSEINVAVKKATESAIEKIQKAGGTVTLQNKK